MNFSGLGDQIFEIINIENQKIGTFEWEWWILILLFLCYTIGAGIVICGQVMIITYIGKYAPKKQPINRMILIDQVNLLRVYSLAFNPQSPFPKDGPACADGP